MPSAASLTMGARPDVVLLHGWGASGAIWSELATLLETRYRVLMPDLPLGSGATGGKAALDRVARSIAEEAPDSCSVIGWSLGGQVALSWAHAAPQQVRRLVLIATTPRFTSSTAWPHAMEPETLENFRAAVRIDEAGAVRRFMTLQAMGDERSTAVTRRLRACRKASAAMGGRALDRGLDILMQADLRDRLGGIGQPTLVIHGERDSLVPLAAAEFLQTQLPRGRLTVIEGVAHAPFVSDAQAVFRHVDDFFHE
jgi:pimeloyl-[acyl-carrier protein] methyl ester esterase